MNDVPPTELTQSPATTFGHEVDALFYTMLGLSGLLVAVLIVLIVTFCVRFHRLRDTDRDRRPPGWLEYLWTAIPLAIFMGLFVWGATLFLDIGRVPADALEIRAVAKQWMWKFYHPNGRREINELHLPVDRPIRIVLSSEDVIHSFYVPGFRIKQDALPGRFTRTWFEVDRTGTYRLFCAEYCGTAHSRMRGTVRVLEQAEYGDWLAAGDAAPGLAEAGQRLFTALGCSGCHARGSTVHAPVLDGLYGRPVALASGETVIADEGYIRDSILLPEKDVVAGFEPVMPSFAGQIDESELIKLIAYIESLSEGGSARE